MKILCIGEMGIKRDETASYPGWGTTGHIGIHLPQLEGQTGHLGAGHRLLILRQYLHCKLYKIKKLLPLTMYYICHKYSCSIIFILRPVHIFLFPVGCIKRLLAY